MFRYRAPGGRSAEYPRRTRPHEVHQARLNAQRGEIRTAGPDQVIFRYAAPGLGGGIAEVPRRIRPYDVLQVRVNASRHEIKAAFGKLANHNLRQMRVMASLSYNILMSKVQRYRKIHENCYEVIAQDDVVVLAAVGDTARLLAQLWNHRVLLTCTDEHNHNLLYLTTRSGFYDTTEALLKMGIPVNEKQVDGSTALHTASFYGQQLIVELLLRYGADPTLTNRWGQTAAGEACSVEIKQVILSHKEDCVSTIACSLMGNGLALGIRSITYNSKVIAREVLRRPDVLDLLTQLALDVIRFKWVTAWHGTKAKYLESILRYGLMPSESKLPDGSTIKPPPGHFKLGATCFGIHNWASAIFLSPSITYASHSCYSERIFSGNDQWCVLIKALVEPSACTVHKPTVQRYDPVDGEPDTPELRIIASSEDEILRVESFRNVVVTSVVFVSLAFLQNTARDLTFDELARLFAINQ